MSPSPPSPSTAASAAPPATATGNSAPSSTPTAPVTANCLPSPDSPTASTTSPKPSRPSQPKSADKKKNSARSNAEPLPRGGARSRISRRIHEQRIRGELEPINPVRLELEGLPDPPDRRLGQPRTLGHRRPRPARGVARRLLQRGDHDRLHLIDTDRGRPSGPGLVQQPVQALGHKPASPLTHRRNRTVQLCRNTFVVRTLRAGKHNLGTQRQRLGGLRPARPPNQLLALFFGQGQLGLGSPGSRHAHSLQFISRINGAT